MATEKQRTKIVEALFGLLAERDWGAIGLPDLAERAGMSLAQLRRAHDGKLDILADFARRIDAAVLADEDEAMREEPARDRLFDVIMRRFEALTPYKPGLRGLARSARRDPALAAALVPIGLGSQRWMLAAAGLPHAGWGVALGAPALALAYRRALTAWLEEDDPGLPKTMAALDRALDRLFELAGRVARARRFLQGLRGTLRDRKGTDRSAGDTEAASQRPRSSGPPPVEV